MIKSELRSLFLERRSKLSGFERTGLSQRVAERFFSDVDLSSTKTLHCFIPIEKFNEIDTSLIYERIWRDSPSIRTVAPRLDRAKSELESLEFRSEIDLAESAWGIREPSHDRLVDHLWIDVVVVPLLCFDKAGFRVGYGKGFYDKFLSRCRADCLKVGVSYFPPVDKIDDANQMDVRLDRCVTPSDVFNFT